MIRSSCRRRPLWKFDGAHQSRRSFSRPAFAPKPTIDIKHICRNPGLYEQNCKDRNYAGQGRNSWRLVKLQRDWLNLQEAGRAARERINAISRQLAKAATSGDAGANAQSDLLEEARGVKASIEQVKTQEKVKWEEIEALALELPNLSSEYTPEGDEPIVLDYVNEHPESNPKNADRVWRSHVDVGSELDLLDFAGAATTSGWGWYFLKNEAALLEQALIQYTLSVARKRGWQVVSPPSIVYSHIAAACGFQPRDQNEEQQIYTLAQSQKDQDKPTLSLAGTAEIPFAGMKANTALEMADLPLKVIGPSRCYLSLIHI